MAALVVNMATDPDRKADVYQHFRNDITAWAQQQPGFVRGEWLISDDRDAGLGFVVFDSVDAANRAAVGPRHHVHDSTRAWNITGVAVYESIASART